MTIPKEEKFNELFEIDLAIILPGRNLTENQSSQGFRYVSNTIDYKSGLTGVIK